MPGDRHLDYGDRHFVLGGKMRKKLTAVFAALAFMVVGTSLFTPADAGRPGNTFTVVKVVEGPVPPGSVFEVEVDCVEDQFEGGNVQDTFEFDENGDPIGDNSVSVGLFTECTAVETVTNGATVTYACEAEAPVPTSPEGNGGFVPVECLDDQTVRYDEVIGAQGTITVTNTFEETPPPDIEPDDVDADVVAATPSFTG